MELHFFGAADTVTGSRYLLRCGEQSVLVDCGLFQGFKVLRERNWAPFPADPRSISAVILTHAHLDHSGYLPLLVRSGFQGPIYCTHATADLCPILLMDSAALQEEDAERANRRRYTRHSPALPLYTSRDATLACRRLHPMDWHQAFDAGPFMASFRPAGHILGAASVRIEGGGTSVLFSGDLGRQGDLIMKAPQVPPAADHVVIESTYGNRIHDKADAQEVLGDAIRRTAKRGGVVLIPSFAVGRAQDVLYRIHLLKRAGTIPRDLPVFLNSPMATDVTEVYGRHGDDHRLSEKQVTAMCKAATIVGSSSDSKELNRRRMPMVIIAGSGMATGGRILHHLVAFADDPRNTLIFPGFQAGGTRGAAIVGGARSVRIFGQDVDINAEVVSFDGLSAHADADELMRWLGQMPAPPKSVFVTHGEPSAADTLRARIRHELGWAAQVPEHLSSHTLGRPASEG
ncbi:MAG: MBL fold metallo-hydrolase [Alphaproteobacteria bacterium]|nr:MBL fold metallo-hydrolase [Alphaproteobacteria bacterium]